MEARSTLNEIPEYLRPYIAKQDPSLYTPMDHASWRFILKISMKFFSKHAHQKYLDGLRETGISIERIPLIEEMNDCLKQFGWQAVSVSGFIPPAVFMEFLSIGVLPIACDMRTMDHLAYTPAPDIVHEAAGHAPIIADPEYRAYLKSYGEISRKAIFSYQDMDVYQAIRVLSDTKENPQSTPEEIAQAQRNLDHAIASVTFESEATLLSRMAWWTFEYGLVGDLNNPKIYGAGLLSSMGESYHCLGPKVQKIPFSLRCTEVSYDITRPQPQLFVAPHFQSLRETLDSLADQMAFRKGGLEGLQKAKQAQTVTTTALDTGIQISGKLTEFRLNASQQPIYARWTGPVQLAYEDQQIAGQGADYHKEGFSSSIEKITHSQLHQAGLEPGKTAVLDLSSGIKIQGELTQILERKGAIILLTFKNCTVTFGEEILFRPEWGNFDMVVGSKISSVFGGAADRKKYLAVTGGFHQKPGKQKTNLTPKNKELNILYAQLRKLRESKQPQLDNSSLLEEVTDIYYQLKQKYPEDWLLRFEILELLTTSHLQSPLENELRNDLSEISGHSLEIKETIQRGLELLS